MVDPTDEQTAAPNSMHQNLMIRTVHMKKNGVYVVTPASIFKPSYILNDDQLHKYENWYVDIFSKAANRALTIREWIGLGAVLGAVGAVLAALAGAIEIYVAIGLGGALYALAYILKSRNTKTSYLNLMEAWPFPDAPKTKLRYRDYLKATVMATATMPLIKWFAWLWFGVSVALMITTVVSIGYLAVGGVFGRDAVDATLALMALVALMILFPLPIVMSRRAFKRDTGFSLTTQNLHLHQMGRLSGAG